MRHLTQLSVVCTLWATGIYASAEEYRDAYQTCLYSLNHASGNPDNAICSEALRDGTLSTEELSHVHAAIAMQHLAVNQISNARRSIESALELAPADPWVQANFGSLLLREQNYAQALMAYNSAIDAIVQVQLPGPDRALANVNLAAVLLNRSVTLRALGRYDEAQQDYDQYLELTGFAKQSNMILGPLQLR